MSDAEPVLANARALLGAGRASEAQPLLEQLCREQPALAEPRFLLGAAHHLAGRLAEALAAFEQACTLDPRHAQALNARAGMLSLLGRPSEALRVYESLLAREPGDARVVVNIAIVFEQLGQTAQALERYTQALELDPASLPALLNRSALYLRTGRSGDALADAEHAVLAYPASVEAQYNRAQALLVLDRYEGALSAAGKVVALDPAHVGGHVCRGLALSCLGQIVEAREALQRARAADPAAFRSLLQAVWRAAPGGRGGWEYAQDTLPDPRAIYLVRGVDRLARCDWRGRDVFLSRFEALVRDGSARGDPVCDWSLPFATLFLPLAPDVAASIIGAVAQRVIATSAAALPPLSTRAATSPMRIGYLSASFRRHPSAFLNGPIIDSYDRSRVQVHAYVLNPPEDSPEARWLAAGCTAVRHCHGLAHEAIARQIREDGIQILIDISAALDWSRPEVLRLRPAPINVAYMGALLPSGGDWIDYRIVDRSIAPSDCREFGREQLVVLPRTTYAYAPGPVRPEPPPDRAAVGLPEIGTVLCCFNGAYKIDSIMFGAWMRVLARAPGSVLWLLGEGEVERNLKAEALERGIDPRRLIFAPRVSIAAHLGRSRLADLFLDTLPCNAHTTAVESLYCDVPVLTLPGHTAAGRCAASVLRAVAMPDLVAASLQEYESKAVQLATDAAAVASLKARLAAARSTSPLWDAQDLARRFERTFEIMWDRHAAGVAPSGFELA